jgi:hypothetical protein
MWRYTSLKHIVQIVSLRLWIQGHLWNRKMNEIAGYPVTIMVWGAISTDYKSPLIPVDGTQTRALKFENVPEKLSRGVFRKRSCLKRHFARSGRRGPENRLSATIARTLRPVFCTSRPIHDCGSIFQASSQIWGELVNRIPMLNWGEEELFSSFVCGSAEKVLPPLNRTSEII